MDLVATVRSRGYLICHMYTFGGFARAPPFPPPRPENNPALRLLAFRLTTHAAMVGSAFSSPSARGAAAAFSFLFAAPTSNAPGLMATVFVVLLVL